MTYKSIPIRLSVDFFQQKLCRPEGSVYFKVMKGENLGPRIFDPAKLLFRSDREIKSFIGDQKLYRYQKLR